MRHIKEIRQIKSNPDKQPLYWKSDELINKLTKQSNIQKLTFRFILSTNIKIQTLNNIKLNPIMSTQYGSYEKEVIFNNIRSMVQQEVNKVIAQHLDSKNYNVNDAQTWTNQICDEILRVITSKNKNFKFITNCIIMQKADCGLNLSGSCFWDNEVDGTVTVKWDSASLICIVNVFGCAL